MRKRSVLYLEIANTLKKQIQDNFYPVGTMLPTEKELEELFSVSKITVRQAIELLVQQGYVKKESGRGTTVISNRLFNKLSKGDSFSSLLENKGFSLEKEIKKIELVAPPKEVKELGLEDEKVTKVTRLYYLDQQVYISFSHYLPASSYQAVAENIQESSMYRILADQGFLIDHFEDFFSVVELTEAEQALLETNEKIAMRRVRQSLTAENKVMEVSISLYNTSMEPYSIAFEI